MAGYDAKLLAPRKVTHKHVRGAGIWREAVKKNFATRGGNELKRVK